MLLSKHAEDYTVMMQLQGLLYYKGCRCQMAVDFPKCLQRVYYNDFYLNCISPPVLPLVIPTKHTYISLPYEIYKWYHLYEASDNSCITSLHSSLHS